MGSRLFWFGWRGEGCGGRRRGEWGGEKGFERFGELCEMEAMVEGVPMNG
jgi:hypothetical protein